jgi:transcriptional regulator with XRE-family HTH domain
MSQDPDVPFGAHLRRLREASGFTQEELAARSGLAPMP